MSDPRCQCGEKLGWHALEHGLPLCVRCDLLRMGVRLPSSISSGRA
jgi:hypothetical protein